MNTFVRVQFSSVEEDKADGTGDQKIPIQKTQSFKGMVLMFSHNFFATKNNEVTC